MRKRIMPDIKNRKKIIRIIDTDSNSSEASIGIKLQRILAVIM
jgi:hypothetical protein